METQPIEMVVLPQLTLPMVTLAFPKLYIIAPAPERDTLICSKEQVANEFREDFFGNEGALTSVLLTERVAMYRLETAPAWAFDAWARRIASEQLCNEAISWVAMLLRIDRSRWNVQEKWRIINTLAEAGCTLPLFSREEAAIALLAMREDCDE